VTIRIEVEFSDDLIFAMEAVLRHRSGLQCDGDNGVLDAYLSEEIGDLDRRLAAENVCDQFQNQVYDIARKLRLVRKDRR